MLQDELSIYYISQILEDIVSEENGKKIKKESSKGLFSLSVTLRGMPLVHSFQKISKEPPFGGTKDF